MFDIEHTSQYVEPGSLTPEIADATIDRGAHKEPIKNVIEKIDGLLSQDLATFIAVLQSKAKAELPENTINCDTLPGVIIEIASRLTRIVSTNSHGYGEFIKFSIQEVADEIRDIVLPANSETIVLLQPNRTIRQVTINNARLTIGLFRNKSLPYEYQLRFKLFSYPSAG